MPTVRLAGWAAAPGPSAPSRAIAPSRASAARGHDVIVGLGRMSVSIDPLLGIDPALQVTGLDAAGPGARPRVVGVARPPELIVEDAEVDERLDRIAGEALHRGQVVLAQRERRAIHRDPALGIAGGVLVGGDQRAHRGAGLAQAPLLDRDRLPARRQELPDLVAEPGLVEQALELGHRLLARRERAVAVAGVGAEQLRAEPRVGTPQVARLV